MLTVDKATLRKLPVVPPAEVFPLFNSRPTGLTTTEAAAWQSLYGKNVLPQPVKRSLWLQLLDQLTHFMALLLWTAGLLAFLVDMPELAWATWTVVTINAGFSFWQEYRADKALTALTRILPRKVKLYRNGSLEVEDAEELVSGDVFVVEAGDHVPADARLIEADALLVDLSLLTGESLPVERTAASAPLDDQPLSSSSNLLFAGTSVAAGRGVAVVYATGKETELGKVTQLTAGLTRQKSTLELQVQRIVRFITMIALLMGGVVFALAVSWIGLDTRESFIFAIGIIVANVPEGLLPTVSLSLAVGVQRMARQNALVRRLSAVESLSATTVICTDKTGTLTLNEVTVKLLWIDGQEITVTGNGYEQAGDIKLADENLRQPLDMALTIAAVCSEADIAPDKSQPGNWQMIGDPTEAALLIAAEKNRLSILTLRREFHRESSIPFDSQRKMMSVVVTAAGSTLFTAGETVALIKGAPLEVLHCCSFVLQSGRIFALTPDERQRIAAANDSLAAQGHRVLAFAYRHYSQSDKDIEQDLIFVGMAAMMDPPRPEVAESLVLCRQAGIKVTMLTGDYGLTAAAIGRNIGLITGDDVTILTGTQIEILSATELQAVLQSDHPVICARTNPEHKLKIVEAYKALGEIVAVTGDGVNDAPALRAAHIGIAMGRGGTDVAREVADIILLDDHFSTIIKAIEQGRAIYDNIRKFMTYILSSNIPEVVPFIVMAFARIPPALNILQILAIDIGTDMLPALALGAEKPETGILKRQPRHYTGDLLDKSLMLRAYGWLGLIEAILSMTAFLSVWFSAGYSWADLHQITGQILYNTADPAVRQLYEYATTMTLAAIIACQVGNLFVCRSEHLPFWQLSFTENRLLWIGLSTEILLTAGIIYLPFFAAIFVVQPLTLADWGFLALCPLVLIVCEELRRYVTTSSAT